MIKIRLTAKQLHCCIKNGHTPESLCERYQCTREELRDHIFRLYHQDKAKAKELYAALEANRKISRKENNPGTAEEAIEEVVMEKATRKKPVTREEINIQDTTIESLEKEEVHLSRKVISLESEHKSWRAKHHDCAKRLRAIQDELEEIKSRLEDCREEYDRVIKEANDIASTMNHISEIRREKVVALETVRQKLDELKSVTLCVYSDGRIEAPDRPDFVPDDEGYRELVKELSERPECLDLRVRDIQVLARLLKISENISGKLTLICEVTELENAFTAIKSN